MGIVPGAWARELIAQGQEEQGARAVSILRRTIQLRVIQPRA
jgi:hypothetical protein